MRDILEALAAGEVSVDEAEVELRGYVSGDAGRFDATRTQRSGVPEAILAAGKTPGEMAELVSKSLETTDRAIATRLDADQWDRVQEALTEEFPDADATFHERSAMLVVHGEDFVAPDLDASVGIVTAGTSDAVPAGEAELIAREMGADVHRVDDVGVAAITRLVDRLPDLRDQDVLIVAAGREGALPTVVAGLVDVPVIGLPVSTGYGEGGEGKAALAGMLQSCTALSVVNIDAGFTAGAQAGLIARRIDEARDS